VGDAVKKRKRGVKGFKERREEGEWRGTVALGEWP